MSKSTQNTLQTILKGAGLILAGTIIQLGLSFAAKLLMARFLEVGQYGVVTLGIISINILVTISLFGLDTGLARYLPRYEQSDAARSTVYFTYVISITTSVILAVLTYTFAGHISQVVFNNPALEPVLKIMVIGIPAWTILDIGVGITRGRSEVLPRVYMKNILLPLGRFLLVSVAIIFGLAELGVAGAYVGAYVFSSVILTYIILTRVPPTLPSFGQRQRELIVFSTPLMFSGISSFVYGNVDLFLLGFFINSKAVGIYNVVYPLASLLRIGTGMFSFLFIPVVSSLHMDGEMNDAKRVYQVITKWLLIMMAPLFAVLILFPEMTITVLFGSKYDGGALTLRTLAFGFFFINLTGMNSSMLSSIGQSKVVMIGDVAAMTANVVFNLLLIPQYGFLGAGVATALSYIGRDLIHGVSLYQSTGFHPFTSSMIRPALFTAVAVAVIYVPVTTFLRVTIPRLILLFTLFLTIYAVSILRFGGVDSEDIVLLNTIDDSTNINIGWIKYALTRVVKE